MQTLAARTQGDSRIREKTQQHDALITSITQQLRATPHVGYASVPINIWLRRWIVGCSIALL